MPVAFKESHKAKDKLVRAVSGKSISHSMSEEGGVGVGVCVIILISKLLNKCLVSSMKNAAMQKAIIFEEFTRTTACSNLSNA